MVLTYTGILREQGRIEWDGPLPLGEGVRVMLTVEQPASPPISEHARLLQLLTESGRGIETVIPDPVAWQKEMRTVAQGHLVAREMEHLSQTDLHKVFGNPLEWQWEMRQSRTLPGRDE